MTSSHATLLPSPGALVRDQRDGAPSSARQVVTAIEASAAGQIWLTLYEGSRVFKRQLHEVSCGVDAGDHVELVDPAPQERRHRGAGEVVTVQQLGVWQLVYVRSFHDGVTRSYPYQLLRAMTNPLQALLRCTPVPAPSHQAPLCSTERLKLHVLAHALEQWNESTGALSRLDIDPLPHQLQLVSDLLRSGQLNWMIADDVGLGKTIEVGMLLAALKHRRGFERVLIVTPAGLTRQWKEELREKFEMRDYVIYDEDVRFDSEDAWRRNPLVIASIDRLKREEHLSRLREAGSWDLVIFDEAHRLTRRDYGRQWHASERYELARELRALTDNLLMLTATPHQGRPDLFCALLELLRPDLSEEVEAIELSPQLLSELVYRNRKADVTDADGAFIFKGQQTRALPIRSSRDELAFDELLQSYLQEGYERAAELGQKGRSIGFVMTIYRKLAASSHAAIEGALLRRRARLAQDQQIALVTHHELTARGGDLEGDERFAGEELEALLEQAQNAHAFFDGELEQLDALLELLVELRCADSKLHMLMERLLPELLREEPDRRVLIFTEFRHTQAMLREALGKSYGAERVGIIQGGMKQAERDASVLGFETHLQFLISTEAGGEGLNLHRGCNTMINYDLPWNPMRLVQRVGRLYRYGQERPVVVVNLHTPDTIDGHVQELLHERIKNVVKDLGGWSEEYSERLHAEIFGEVVELLDGDDLETILKEAMSCGVERTEERIALALKRAADARTQQSEVLEHARRYDAEARRGELLLSHEHMDRFVEGMLCALGCTIEERLHRERVWRVRLSEAVRSVLRTKAETIRVTTRRSMAHVSRDVRMLDFDDPLFQHLIDVARSAPFGGRHAMTRGVVKGVVSFARLTWQDRRGRKGREELVSQSVTATGGVELNAPWHAQWLLEPVLTGQLPGQLPRDARDKITAKFISTLNDRLAGQSGVTLYPMSHQTLGVAELLG